MPRKRQVPVSYEFAPLAALSPAGSSCRPDLEELARALLEGRRRYEEAGEVLRLRPDPPTRENLRLLRWRAHYLARRLGMKVRTFTAERGESVVIIPLLDGLNAHPHPAP